MANADNPHGLRPLMRTQAGGVPKIQEFSKIAGYGTAIRLWDVVKRVADGSIEANTVGVAASGVNLVPGAASTLTTHIVMTSPDAIYEAQDNADTDGFAEADMGLNCELEYNAGSATTLISGHELDESTAAAGAAFDVKLLQKLNVPDNAYGSWLRVEVVFNKHRMYPGTAGV